MMPCMERPDGSSVAWLDAHVHLDEMDDEQRAWALRMARLGRYRAMVPGVYPDQWERALSEWGHVPWLDFAVGVHPWEVASGVLSARCDDWRPRLCSALTHPAVVAIGEIGLDWARWRDPRTRARGEALCVAQLEIARARQLPVVLHVVRAHARMVAILKEHGRGVSGMVHAFSGSLEELRAYERLGWCVGLGSLAARPRARRAAAAARAAAVGMWVLETDAPFMDVVDEMPRAGASMVAGGAEGIRMVAQTIAALRGTSLESVCTESRRAYETLFGCGR